jgi:cation diffusion facilitator family transporter
MTFFAVRISGRPADRDHPYGHGKIENLSALVETFLLLVTCLWIIYGAVQRMVSQSIEIEVNIWSFAVMVTSIVVDVSRSRLLYRVARKYNSQALEADALHFSTDIWSSGVVIVGLGCVKLGEWAPAWEFLHYADAVAALLVALIVVRVGSKLGLRTAHALLDTAPAGLEEKIIAAVEAHPAVANCHNVRLRASGAQHFIDVHILADGDLTLKQAHDLTEEIERVIQQLVPGADVTVHPEPRAPAA